jgi:Flp pilus assembly pilin Flp
MKNKFGSSIIEFTLILGIVTLSLIAMQVYIKRGIEGKTKDLADHFIHSNQEGSLESNPDTVSFSATNTTYESKSIAKGSLGGSFEVIMPAANNNTTMVAYGNSVEYSGIGGV